MTTTATQGSASGVQVTVTGRSAASALGVRGLVLSATGTGALASAGGQVGIRVDYSGFAGAYGGDYAARLRLAVLPDCALTTPSVPACRKATPVPTANDGKGILTGTVTLPGVAQAATPATSAARAGRAVVMTVESGPSGSGGNYAATPLNPNGTWAVQDGAFDYTYPLTVPQAVTGSTPQVALAYDSQSVDGETSAANTQGGWIGDGWAATRRGPSHGPTSRAGWTPRRTSRRRRTSAGGGDNATLDARQQLRPPGAGWRDRNHLPRAGR